MVAPTALCTDSASYVCVTVYDLPPSIRPCWMYSYLHTGHLVYLESPSNIAPPVSLFEILLQGALAPPLLLVTCNNSDWTQFATSPAMIAPTLATSWDQVGFPPARAQCLLLWWWKEECRDVNPWVRANAVKLWSGMCAYVLWESWNSSYTRTLHLLSAEWGSEAYQRSYCTGWING